MLVVKRGLGTWFHATFSANRESISRHGLDWTRMTGSGIAGSRRPEAEGVFLCADLESAEWFAQMGTRHGQAVDIWAVRLDGTWLIGDPGASGGGDDVWMIAPSRSGRADSGSRAENFAARDRPVRESRPPRGSLVPRYHHVRSEPSDEIEKHSADRRAEQEGN